MVSSSSFLCLNALTRYLAIKNNEEVSVFDIIESNVKGVTIDLSHSGLK